MVRFNVKMCIIQHFLGDDKKNLLPPHDYVFCQQSFLDEPRCARVILREYASQCIEDYIKQHDDNYVNILRFELYYLLQ